MNLMHHIPHAIGGWLYLPQGAVILHSTGARICATTPKSALKSQFTRMMKWSLGNLDNVNKPLKKQRPHCRHNSGGLLGSASPFLCIFSSDAIPQWVPPISPAYLLGDVLALPQYQFQCLGTPDMLWGYILLLYSTCTIFSTWFFNADALMLRKLRTHAAQCAACVRRWLLRRHQSTEWPGYSRWGCRS